MPDKHIVIQKFNSKQCDVARLASGYEDEYWVVATAPNVDVARGLVRRLNTAPEPVAPAIEGKTAYEAKRKAEQKAENATLRKKYPLTKPQRRALQALQGQTSRHRQNIDGFRALPALEKTGLVVARSKNFWQQTRLGQKVLHAHEAVD